MVLRLRIFVFVNITTFRQSKANGLIIAMLMTTMIVIEYAKPESMLSELSELSTSSAKSGYTRD